MRENKSWSCLNQNGDFKPKLQYLSQASPRSNLNKSNISMHSTYLWSALHQVEMFPAEFSELLRFQDRNISEFKMKIEQEKNRLGLQLQSFKRQINHHLDDFKISSLSQLDNVYKMYMQRYSKFKAEIYDLKKMRDEIQIQLSAKAKETNIKSNKLAVSNFQTVKSMEEDLIDIRKGYIINYIAQLQKIKIIPLTQDARILMILTQYENGYYLPYDLKGLLGNLKQHVIQRLRNIQERKLHMRNLEQLFAKNQQSLTIFEQQIKQNNKSLTLQQKDRLNPERNRKSNRSIQRQLFTEKIQNSQKQSKLKGQQFTLRCIEQKYRQKKSITDKTEVSIQSIRDLKLKERQFDQFKKKQKKLGVSCQQIQSHPFKSSNQLLNLNKIHTLQKPAISRFPHKSMPTNVSKNQQVCAYQRLQQPSIKQINNFRIGSQTIILCALTLKNQYLAIGSMDGMIQIYSLKFGTNITTLIGHRSSICSLAVIELQNEQYLGSGSDHGCSTILLWDMSNWSLKSSIENHSAAITAIVDLNDKQNFVSGSYDKKIWIHNLKQKKKGYHLSANKSQVTGIVLNSNSKKMVSCGLDNSLSIWQIVRSASNIVSTIFLQRIILNNTMICSMTSSILQQQVIYIGTKDGKVKIINIQKGQATKNIVCCNNAVIEMVVLERQTKPEFPYVVAWACQQQNLKIINTQNGRIKRVPIKGYIQFGSGIGPKSFFLGKGQLAMLSQSKNWREINFFEISEQ